MKQGSSFYFHRNQFLHCFFFPNRRLCVRRDICVRREESSQISLCKVVKNVVYTNRSAEQLRLPKLMINKQHSWVRKENLPECEYECASSGRHSYWRLCRSRGTGTDAHLQNEKYCDIVKMPLTEHVPFTPWFVSDARELSTTELNLCWLHFVARCPSHYFRCILEESWLLLVGSKTAQPESSRSYLSTGRWWQRESDGLSVKYSTDIWMCLPCADPLVR